MKLSEIEVGSPIFLHISANQKSMKMDATVKNPLSENTILVSLHSDFNKKLNFGSVTTDVEYYPDGKIPVKWNNVKVLNSDTGYIVQAVSDSTRLNRRNTFRVGVSSAATLKTAVPNCPRKVTLRDVSLTGFSLADRKNELPLALGNTVSVKWEDSGYELDLLGKLVRIEKRADVTIFGFEITNICKDLSSYLNKKQSQRN